MTYQGKPFSLLIREGRDEHEPPLTQGALAKRIGVKQPTVSAWESGKTSPSVQTLVDLSRVLGIDLAELTNAAAEVAAVTT